MQLRDPRGTRRHRLPGQNIGLVITAGEYMKLPFLQFTTNNVVAERMVAMSCHYIGVSIAHDVDSH